MNKNIHREVDIRDKVAAAVDKVALPVIETIGPLGKNVLYESDKGTFALTNDGITIARQINLKDPIENAIAEIIKDGATRTNQMAGDGTSTTILFSRELITKSRDLSTQGMSYRAISELYDKVINKLLKRIEKQKRVVKDKHTKLEIATISANNDKQVAAKVVEAVDTAGLEGQIFLEFSQNEKTIIDKETGFRITPGMIFQNLYSDVSRPMVAYQDIPVIILDKKLYYAEETEHILRVAQDVGFKAILIVAKDFAGDAPNTIIANHVRGSIRVATAKLDDDIGLEDLAIYLGGTVLSEAAGRRVDSITKDDFIKATRITADPQKILLSNVKDTPELKKRIQGIQDELEKDKDNTKLKSRLSSMTNGIVTLRIGAATQQEAREKLFRFEDSINATRAAIRDGYLVGGGLSIYNAFVKDDYDNEDEVDVALKLAQASMIRISRNAQMKLDWKKVGKHIGLNALTGQYEDLLKAGVVEPYKVAEMALKNAASVASMINSIGTYILNDYDSDSNDDKQKS